LPEIISNTSPFQYLHQLDALDLLAKLVTKVTVPPAVVDELATGRKLGINLPDLQNLDWITVRRPFSAVALPMVTDLGGGEREVLALALETPDSVCVLDDALARQIARALQRKKLLGTTASVICRLEGADYEGHSLAMLKLYAAALNLTAKRLAESAKRLFSGSDQRNLLMSHYKIV